MRGGRRTGGKQRWWRQTKWIEESTRDLIQSGMSGIHAKRYINIQQQQHVDASKVLIE